jgi:tRNA uridine 5-carboxymethylaminomethyl modification enzyme
MKSDLHRRIESALKQKRNAIHELVDFLEKQQITPTAAVNSTLSTYGSSPLKSSISLGQLLRRPEISLTQIRTLIPDIPRFSNDVDTQAELNIKYAGYVDRQMDLVKRFQKMEQARLPDRIDYSKIEGLSREVREKLAHIRPMSLGQASRIPGITPAAMSLLSVHLKKRADS